MLEKTNKARGLEVCQDKSMGKESSFKQMVMGQLDIHMQKYEVEHLLSIIHKN